jgi:valyl-tRNA synthetase
MERTIPERPSLEGLESKWHDRWESAGTYRFDRTVDRAAIYSIDTPPPTVSGSLHVGHVLSFTHTDLVARFRRMLGFEVFYPMGWDDNGLPTERRVQNRFGVRCDPSLPYDPALRPPIDLRRDGVPATPVSRRTFEELCAILTAEDEAGFEALWRRLGLSVDWALAYTTNGRRARGVSQRAFLRMLARGDVYRAEGPVLWDVDFRTAVAQAEIEDRPTAGAAVRIRFRALEGDGSWTIETTRPELLPACVAVVAHPDDDRHRPLVGTTLVTPLFGAPVPVLVHPGADPGKGTGLAMVCTFGDVTDVAWWRDLRLPLRPVIDPEGTLRDAPWGGPGWETVDQDRARGVHRALTGLTIEQARARTVELLHEAGDLDGPLRPLTHEVKFYENGRRPLEFLTTAQWYVRTLDLREALLELGRQLRWHPDHMRTRLESWVEGLNADWCISRQRFLGVPFPVWYAVRQDGSVDHEALLLPDEASVPVDPAVGAPPGFREEQRGTPGGFAGDPDVMDTWATSSLTPHIAGGWTHDPDLFARVFPMDLRPQAHEIIRTWPFTTLVRSHLEHDEVPWSDVAISGWVLDPDHKKMSKSKGNTLTPSGLLERYGSDAVRYWAARARLGVDTTFDEGQIRVGRRLATKLLNAGRFVLSLPAPPADQPTPTEPLDRSALADLAGVVDRATASFLAYDHTGALESVERSFWTFCDDLVELVKNRAYGSRGPGPAASAVAGLRAALSAYLRLLAPYLPFVTEEVWSWWQEGSVHRARWPDPGELRDLAASTGPEVWQEASGALRLVRAQKASRGLSAATAVEAATLGVPDESAKLVGAALDDLAEAGRIQRLSIEERPGPPAVSLAI